MKYAVRGKLRIEDETEVIQLFNTFTIWRLITQRHRDLFIPVGEDNPEYYIFEVWVDDEESKNDLFERLKLFVDEYGEYIDWHECTHDEENPTQCTIVEEYRK